MVAPRLGVGDPLSTLSPVPATCCSVQSQIVSSRDPILRRPSLINNQAASALAQTSRSNYRADVCLAETLYVTSCTAFVKTFLSSVADLRFHALGRRRIAAPASFSRWPHAIDLAHDYVFCLALTSSARMSTSRNDNSPIRRRRIESDQHPHPDQKHGGIQMSEPLIQIRNRHAVACVEPRR